MLYEIQQWWSSVAPSLIAIGITGSFWNWSAPHNTDNNIAFLSESKQMYQWIPQTNLQLKKKLTEDKKRYK